MQNTYKSEIEKYKDELYQKLHGITKVIPVLQTYAKIMLFITGINLFIAVSLLTNVFQQYLDLIFNYLMPVSLLLFMCSVIIGFIFEILKKNGENNIKSLTEEINGNNVDMKWCMLAESEKEKMLKLFKPDAMIVFTKFRKDDDIALKPGIIATINFICACVVLIIFLN